jgi:hypothetical protein
LKVSVFVSDGLHLENLVEHWLVLEHDKSFLIDVHEFAVAAGHKILNLTCKSSPDPTSRHIFFVILGGVVVVIGYNLIYNAPGLYPNIETRANNEIVSLCERARN